MKNNITEVYNLLKPELDLIQEEIVLCLDSEQPLINEIGNHILSGEGKKIRPLLTILLSKILNYKGSNHIKLGAAVELIHTGTLMHDDVIDSNYTRRFKPTANAIWDNSLSILTGDFIFCSAFKLMIKSHSLEALEILSRALSIIISGEVSQLANQKNKNLTDETGYYNIITAKTAVLFGASCKISGIITSQSPKIINNLEKIGELIGIIFQVIDDLIDYFCPTEIIGKDQFNDFIEGKITLPIIKLYSAANAEEKKFLEDQFIIAPLRTVTEAKKVLELLNKYNIDQLIMKEVLILKQELNMLIEGLPNTEYNWCLDAIVNYILSKINT